MIDFFGTKRKRIYSLVTVSNITSIEHIAYELGIDYNQTIK